MKRFWTRNLKVLINFVLFYYVNTFCLDKKIKRVSIVSNNFYNCVTFLG